MQPFQKYILNPLTALMLALGTFFFVRHYHLLEFAHAPYIFALVVFSGYLLLSRKYDPILSYIFFSFAIFVCYKAILIPNRHLSVPQRSEEQQIFSEAALLVASMQYDAIAGGKADFKTHQRMLNLDRIMEMCSCCEDCNFQSLLNYEEPLRSKYIIKIQSETHQDIHYLMTDQFAFYRVNQTGDIQPVFK